MTSWRHAVALALLALPATATAEMCKYADAEGNVHYSNIGPTGPQWRSLGCVTIGSAEETAKLDAAWRAARGKIKLGMTRDQLRNADPLLRHYASRRVIEAVSGKSEWLEFYDFTVLLQNDRVIAIRY